MESGNSGRPNVSDQRTWDNSFCGVAGANCNWRTVRCIALLAQSCSLASIPILIIDVVILRRPIYFHPNHYMKMPIFKCKTTNVLFSHFPI